MTAPWSPWFDCNEHPEPPNSDRPSPTTAISVLTSTSLHLGHLREGREERHRYHRQEEVPCPSRPHRRPVRLRHPQAHQAFTREGHLHLRRRGPATHCRPHEQHLRRAQGRGWVCRPPAPHLLRAASVSQANTCATQVPLHHLLGREHVWRSRDRLSWLPNDDSTSPTSHMAFFGPDGHRMESVSWVMAFSLPRVVFGYCGEWDDDDRQEWDAVYVGREVQATER